MVHNFGSTNLLRICKHQETTPKKFKHTQVQKQNMFHREINNKRGFLLINFIRNKFDMMKPYQ